MASLPVYLYNSFWSESFWLYKNITWDDLVSKDPSIYYPQFRDLLFYGFICAIIVSFVRYFIENFMWKPIGQYYGLKNVKAKQAEFNAILEKVFRKEKRPNDIRIKDIASMVDWEVRKVERWFRIRRNQDKSSLLKKFCESGWRFVYYLSVFIYGLVILCDKPWFWNPALCWKGIPHQHVEDVFFYYYTVSMGYYWSSLILIFSDVKRKDFLELFLHHCSTIILMAVSWFSNYVRMGSLILCVHDATDYLMEAAKMSRYVNKQTLCGVFLGIFTLMWFITRLVILPVKLIYSCFVDLKEEVGYYHFFSVFLIILQVLHVVWFYMIMKIVCDTLKKGETEGDVRSHSEMSDASDSCVKRKDE